MFFSFSYVVEYFMHKGNNHIPKREQLSCLAFVVLPCYLLNRPLCGGIFLSTHTVPVGLCTMGAVRAQTQEGDAALLNSFYCQPSGTPPCAHAIIVDDKVTIEVITVLN